MKSLSLLMVGILSFFTYACGADKTVDDYVREQAVKDKALYDAVAGSYTGIVNSQFDGQVLGAMQLDLRAEMVVTVPQNGGKAITTPVLIGNISFLDQTILKLSATEGSYDPNTGSYSAQIRITRKTGTSELVLISANINGGVIAGSVSALNYPASGGGFQLVKNGRSIEELLKDARPNPPNEEDGNIQVSAFTGNTTFNLADDTTKPVRVVILQPLHNSPEDFLNLIYPIKTVQVSLNYSQSLHLLFVDAVFDTKQGLLTGQMIMNGNQQFSIDCRIPDGRALDCRHLTTGSGVIARTSATLNNERQTDPPDAPEDRQSVTKKFRGKGKLGGRNKDMELMVTLPGKTRLEDLMELFFPNAEKTINVSITFDKETDTRQSFSNSKWDSQNGLVEGSFSGGGIGGYTAYLQCKGFKFTRQREEFACDYWTTRSPVITITFKPPFN